MNVRLRRPFFSPAFSVYDLSEITSLPFDYSLFPPVLTLITAALIIVCFVVLLLMPFPGVPLAGRAVVNGASEAVSALAGLHP